MLWHRQAIFESKGDKLSSSAECRIRTQGLRQLFASWLNACWQTDSAIEDQAKTWTRQPIPMISKHSAHSTSLPVGFRTWHWRYTCLLLLISMLWHRQAIFESKGDELSSPSTCPKLTSHACALLIDNVGNYLYLNNGSFIFEVDPHQFNLRLHHFSQFQRKGRKKKIQKLSDLWLVGEMVNRIGIYGSKVAEGLSAFQRRSCEHLSGRRPKFGMSIILSFLFFWGFFGSHFGRLSQTLEYLYSEW